MSAPAHSGLKPWPRGRSGNAQGSSRRARARAAARRLGLDAITALLDASPSEVDGDDSRERWLNALRSSLSADDVLEVAFPAAILKRMDDDDLAALERVSRRIRELHDARFNTMRERIEKERI